MLCNEKPVFKRIAACLVRLPTIIFLYTTLGKIQRSDTLPKQNEETLALIVCTRSFKPRATNLSLATIHVLPLV